MHWHEQLIFDCYATDEKLCIKCGMPNITTSLFDSSLSSNSSNDSATPQRNTRQKRKANRLRIFTCNVQSLWNKKAELENTLTTNNIDILIGSETHLECNIGDSEVIPTAYQLFRWDRKDGYGGVIILAKSEIISIKIETFQKPVIVSACYRPPGSTAATNENLIKNIDSICKKYSSTPIWIGGDFNLPDIQLDNAVIEGCQNSKLLNDQFLEAFDKNKLTQMVDFPTRKRKTLDLLLTNRPAFVERCTPAAGFGDHQSAIISDIYCHPQKHKPVSRKVYNWRRANLNELNQEIDENIKTLLNSESPNTPINELWSKLKIILLDVLQKHVPSKAISTRFNQPWFNRACKKMARKKRRSYKLYQRTRLDTDWDIYMKNVKKCQKTCKDAYNQHVQDSLISDRKANSKKFFSFIKSKKQDNIGVSILVDKGKSYITDIDMAEIFNKQFSCVFSNDDGICPRVNDPAAPSIGNLVVTPNGVRKLLDGLDPYKASGPDGASVRLLKECSLQRASCSYLTHPSPRAKFLMIGDKLWLHQYIKGETKTKPLLRTIGQLA